MADFTRQQQEAISTLDRNVSVSAGAGSGKTRVLVERFLKILAEEKASAQEILAITFTRKAAREMRERVQKGILDRLAEATDPQRQQYWQEKLNQLDHASITTIDSFCARIIRENPVEAGMDPGFAVREEYEIADFRQEAVHTFMDQELKGENEDFFGLLDIYGPRRLEEMLVLLIDALPDILALGDLSRPYQEELDKEEDLKLEAESALDDLIAVKDTAGPKGKELILRLEEQRDSLHEAIAKGDYETLAEAVGGLRAAGAIKDFAAKLKETVSTLLDLDLNRAGLAQAAQWQTVLERLDQYLFTAAEQQEMYSFSYISAKAVKLLGTDPELLRTYRNKFKFLMVDEFQDTNEEQKRLVYLVSGGDAKVLRGNNLFVVGDAKQSIYRFRGADVSVFKQVRDAIVASGGKDIIMDDNFRSAPEIIQACNVLFEDLLGTDETADVQAQSLTPHQAPTELPRFMVLKKQSETDKGAAQRVKAQWVAAAIQELVASHQELKYGDVAILLPAIRLSRQYEEALDALGIKSQVSDGKGFYDRQEIVDVINLLTCLLNPRKDWALAGFLRSPWGGLSDPEIGELVKDYPELTLWEALQQALEPRQVKLAASLHTLRQMALYQSLPEFFDCLNQEFQAEPLLLSQRGGREKLANYRKLRTLGTEAAMNQGSSVQDFLQRLQLMRALGARESDANQEADPEAVKIMTIHKSKGLEFPAVILPDLDQNAPADKLGIQFIPQAAFGVRVPNAEGVLENTGIYTLLSREKSALEFNEKKRQLYVAMTRAEKYLYMVSIEEIKKKPVKEATQEKWGSALLRVFGPQGPAAGKVAYDECPVESVGILTEEGILAKRQVPHSAPQVPAKVYQQAAPVAFPKALRLSASALLEYDTCPRSYYYHYQRHMPPVEVEMTGTGKHRVSAMDLGTFVHRVLQLMNTLPQEEALELALAENENWSEEKRRYMREDGGALLGSYCASPLYTNLEGYEAQAERDFDLNLFTLGQTEIWFQGSIDKLVFLPDQKLGIVDYKTGHPPVDGEERQGYTRQLAIYALAAETLYKGYTVAWAQLHFLQNNSIWELKDREAETEKLRALLKNLSEWDEETAFPVRTEACSYCPYQYFCTKA